MMSRENFFTKINVHIIQCDNEVRQDTKITCIEDFEEFMKNGKLTGFGSTDFRPVFEYVDELTKKGEFTELKGLILSAPALSRRSTSCSSLIPPPTVNGMLISSAMRVTS